ncbi:uncharacterized protein LOC126891198 [Diabrotica virgifera virgifera]|uniref:Tyr recombinase domain-containing protein n=1 Tax=Diabrotica virgifera virgifera TaxID=50390 RepID=A0ABM5L1M6_DIAVI|nr:uncharacterized protein LOC126891198 [Diabrotica virgifera virgifera]
MSGRLFPADYYRCTTTNGRNRKKSNWFCNKSLSPIKDVLEGGGKNSPVRETEDSLQARRLTSSGDSNMEQVELDRKDVCRFESEAENSPVDDSINDPNFSPSSEDSDCESNGSSNNSTESHDNQNSLGITSDVINNIENLPYDNYGENSKAELKKEPVGKKITEDFCYFCESLVKNFARHIQRNHSAESEVHKILSLPAGCKQRKDLITALRKRGNFLNNNHIQKPVKKPNLTNTILVPCSNCLGFYSSKMLWRHRKQCLGATTANSKIDGQNILLKGLRVDPEVQQKVFPRMRPDEISMAAKKDTLICAFASRYLKQHRETHLINVASRKMRELAKLLIEVKKMESNVNDLFEALHPKYFDTLVAATKIVAKYDPLNNYYKSPTYALNMGTSLKPCYDIAILHALKRKQNFGNMSTANAEADLKTTTQFIEAHWKFEVSYQASNDLSVKKWNKVTIVPLASDLKLLKEYLTRKAKNARENLLKENKNKSHYITLLKCVYCKILLLNRRRPGELQRLPLYLYEKAEAPTNKYEEFDLVVSPCEKILMQRFKRIVIRGKWGKGVPVLFSCDVQEQIETLLKFRDNFLSSKNYLFGNPGTIEPIAGYKVLKQFARECGAKNSNALSATRLRKHLATLSQIFSMTDQDVEQLSTFMGHTPGTHRGSYRLPDDVYQTSKITKLLLLMEQGLAAEHKGKTLNEIKIDLEDDLLTAENVEDHEDDMEMVVSADVPKEGEPKSKQQKQKRVLVKWTDEQKQVVLEFFNGHIKKKRPPKRIEVEQLKEKHPQLLSNKDWLKIKVFIQNTYSQKAVK